MRPRQAHGTFRVIDRPDQRDGEEDPEEHRRSLAREHGDQQQGRRNSESIHPQMSRRVDRCDGEQRSASREERCPRRQEQDRPRRVDLERGQRADEDGDQRRRQLRDSRANERPAKEERQRDDPDDAQEPDEAQVVDRPGRREGGGFDHTVNRPALGSRQRNEVLGVGRRRQAQMVCEREEHVVVGPCIRSRQRRQEHREDRERDRHRSGSRLGEKRRQAQRGAAAPVRNRRNCLGRAAPPHPQIMVAQTFARKRS